MLRLLATFAFIAFALPALAETLPERLRADALHLQPRILAAAKAASAKPALKPRPLDAAMVSDLQHLAMNATQLSLQIDASGGPTDLRCIFRGMAEETDTQLKAAEAAATGAEQAEALARLGHMLDDAAEIAPAVKLASQSAGGVTPAKASATLASCRAVRNF